jgi:hypothetical protein
MNDTRLPRRFLIIILFVVISASGGVFLTRMREQIAPSQPIDFSHQTHAEASVQCLYCHSSAMRSSVASLPSVQKCMGCHTMIATESEEIQVLTSYWEDNEPIYWVEVNQQPDFVYFSHQPHTNAGVSCETCHGNVSQMTIARPIVRMDMGWCLNCHLEQSEEDIARLADCMTCHK